MIEDTAVGASSSASRTRAESPAGDIAADAGTAGPMRQEGPDTLLGDVDLVEAPAPESTG